MENSINMGKFNFKLILFMKTETETNARSRTGTMTYRKFIFGNYSRNSVSTYPLGNEKLVRLIRVYVLTEFTPHRDTCKFSNLVKKISKH